MKKNIILVDTTDNYPFKFTANNSKNELIARGLMESGDRVLIVDGPQGYKNAKTGTLRDKTSSGIEYIVFKKSKLGLLTNTLETLSILRKNKLKGCANHVFLSYSFFPLFLVQALAARVLGYKVIILITEWHVYFEHVSKLQLINCHLFDRLYGYFCQASLPISKEISDKIKKFKKPELMVPILADFSVIQPRENGIGKDLYFMYCGNLGYFSVIELIVDAFEMVKRTDTRATLVLVVDGPASYMTRLHEIIERKNLRNNVEIKSQIQYSELVNLYRGALALLIPLRTQKQDTARFPHKIGEYIATGRPIITGQVGEVGRYFVHRETAFMAQAFTADEYARVMSETLADIELANRVGANGRALGEKFFDFRLYGHKISLFLDSL